jgi:hypothetical protein
MSSENQCENQWQIDLLNESRRELERRIEELEDNMRYIIKQLNGE